MFVGNKKQDKKDKKRFKECLTQMMTSWKLHEDLSILATVPGIPQDLWNNFDMVSFPASLSPDERKQVHTISSALGLFHMSIGEGSLRYISISRTDNFDALITGNMSASDLILGQSVGKWFDKDAVKPAVTPHYFKLSSEEIKQRKLLLGEINNIGCADCVSLKLFPSGATLNPIFDDLSTISFDPIDYVYVDTEGDLIAVAETLQGCTELAFDCEMHHFRSYHGLTCLLQISANNINYLIDTIALWNHVGTILRPLFANPTILKIGHSIGGGDVPCLFRDFGIIVVNAFDTQEAVAALTGIKMGLAPLMEYLKCPIAESVRAGKIAMQHTDWRIRPLTAEMREYALADVHFLPAAYFILARRLVLLSCEQVQQAKSGMAEMDLLVAAALSNSERKQKEQQERDERLKQKEARTALAAAASRGVKSKRSARFAVHAGGVGTDESRGAVGTGKTSRTSDGREVVPAGSYEREDDDEEGEEVDEEGLEVWGTAGGFLDMPSASSVAANQNLKFGHFGEDEDEEEAEAELSAGAGVGSRGGQDLDLLLQGVGEDDDDEDLWDGWGVVTSSPKATKEAAASKSITVEVAVAIATEMTVDQAIGTGQPDAPLLGSKDTQQASESMSHFSYVRRENECADQYLTAQEAFDSLCHSEAATHITRHLLQTDYRLHELRVVLAHSASSCAAVWPGPKQIGINAYSKVQSFKQVRKRATKSGTWSDKNTFVFKQLFNWREATAKLRDESPSYICPADLLAACAHKLPVTASTLNLLSSPLPHSMRASSAPDHPLGPVDIVTAVVESLALWEQQGGFGVEGQQVDEDDEEGGEGGDEGVEELQDEI